MGKLPAALQKYKFKKGGKRAKKAGRKSKPGTKGKK